MTDQTQPLHQQDSSRQRFRSVQAVALILLMPVVTSAQQRGAASTATPASSCSPSIATMKAAAGKAAAAKSDPDAVERAFDEALGIDTTWADMNRAFDIHVSHDLTVLALFPYQTFRVGLREAIRKREPVASVSASQGVVIHVSPSTLDSPDIVRVIVERDGKTVSPLTSSLGPTPMTTRLGARAVINSGDVVFPCSAFKPGARVSVVAIPESGSNLSYDFDPGDLMMLSERRSDLLSSLVGRDAAAVEGQLGKPTRIDGHLWSYEVQTGMVRVYWSDDDKRVVRIDPAALEISKAKRP